METTVANTIPTTKKAPAGNRPGVARANAVSGCALTAALAAMGGRWKLFIVYRLSDGPMHFAALRRSLPQMSAKVLAQQLREMQADGLLERQPRGPVPAPVVYALTRHGLSLLPVAVASLVSIASGDVVLISMLNALTCGSDVIAAMLVVVQVPPGALMRRQGDTVLWKPPAARA